MNRVAALFLVVCATPAAAFTIGSAFTEPCHERVTFEAARDAGLFDKTRVTAFRTDDQTWRKIANYLEGRLGISFADEFDRFLFVTLFIGVRFPDNEGFGFFDIMAIREVHLSPDNQEHHALRASYDDNDGGNAASVARTRAYILDRVRQAREAFLVDDKAERTGPAVFFLEFYGSVDVDVWMPLFHLGAALHALQDSFPHSYRSDDASVIWSVANYLEGIAPDFEEDRDGPQHSDFLDECQNAEVKPLYDAAVRASSDFLKATAKYLKDGDLKVVEAALDQWLRFEPGCGKAAGYCGSKWESLARRALTGGFLCQATPRGAPALSVALLGLACACTLWRRRRESV